MNLARVIFLPILLITTIEGARILAVLPVPNSHYNFCIKVILALAERGHDIVALIPLRDDTLPKNIVQIPIGIRSWVDTMPNKRIPMEEAEFNIVRIQLRFWELSNIYSQYITHNLTAISDFVKSDQSHFDLVICEDFFNQALYGFAYKYKAPLILMNNFGSAHYISEYTGNPIEPSYVGHEFQDIFGDLTFFERAKNLLITAFDIIGRKTYYLQLQNDIAKRLFGDLPGLPHVAELERNTSLVFLNTHYSMGVTQPFLNNIIQIGGIHLEEVKPLDDDIKKVLDSAKDGVILFALGTMVKLSDQPEEKVISMLNALGRFKQTVILQWNSDKPMPVTYSNIVGFKWFSQNDVLAHPNIIAFVTHGGINSAQESINNGVPVICVPFMGDQHIHCLRSEYLGYGIKLALADVTEEKLYKNLNRIVTEPKYKMAAKELSKRFRDRPITPKEQVVFWTEYVLRHKGADFIKGPKRNLYWYQILYLDLLAVVILFSFLLKKIVSLVFSLFSNDKKGYRKVKKS